MLRRNSPGVDAVPMQPFDTLAPLVVESGAAGVPLAVAIGGVTVVFGLMCEAGRRMWGKMNAKDQRIETLTDRNEANLKATLDAIHGVKDALANNARAMNSVLGGSHGIAPDEKAG